MKNLVTAIALAFALPAAAQTAPVAPQPAPHAQHQMGQHQMGQHQSGEHAQHQAQGSAGGCCADRNGNGRMDCCEGMAQGDARQQRTPQPAPQPQPQTHQNH